MGEGKQTESGPAEARFDIERAEFGGSSECVCGARRGTNDVCDRACVLSGRDHRCSLLGNVGEKPVRSAHGHAPGGVSGSVHSGEVHVACAPLPCASRGAGRQIM